MADGQIVFSTNLDNSTLEKQVKDAEAKIERLKKKVEQETDKRTLIEKAMDRNDKAIIDTSAKIDELNAKLDELSRTGMGDSAAAEGVRAKIAEQEKLFGKLVKDGDAYKEKWNKANDAVELSTEKLRAAEKEAASLGAEYAKSATMTKAKWTETHSLIRRQGSSTAAAVRNAFTAAARRASAAWAKVGDKIQSGMRKAFMLGLVVSVAQSLKDMTSDMIKDNERVTASFEKLKATLAGFAAPIAQALAPFVIGAVNVVTAMVMALARLVDSIFQTNIVQSIEQARAAAQASTDAADAMDRQAKATKRLGKAQKEAARWLAAFDELNVMAASNGDDIADSIDDSLSDALPVTEGANPNWDAFDIGKIDEKLSAIMVVIGAALLAVGAVLAFSGINIPLGLTLMAIGALMIYTAVSENWNSVPPKVRGVIVTLLEIVGGALIVIGVILCLTGNIPLGIGFIIAGAALFATAVALDWDNLKNNVDGALNALGMIVGVMIAVIGVVLCFTGHIPLGIAAIIAGIAIFAISAATVDWNNVPERVKTLLDNVVLLIGPAIVVLGVVLCATGHVPLGIAAIIAGIVIFGIVANSVDGEVIPAEVKMMVNTVIAILAPALIVIGIILCAVGNVPLGVAAIIAGIGIFAISNFAIDKEAVPSEVRQIVNSIIAILSPALIVVGIILCAVGNIPLGVAAIIAGIGLFAITQFAVDSEEMPSEVRSMVNSIIAILSPALIVIGVILCAVGNIPLGVAAIIAGIALFAITQFTVDEDEMPSEVRETVGTIMRILSGALVVIGIILCVVGAIPLGIAAIIAGIAIFMISSYTVDEEALPADIEGVLKTLLGIAWKMLAIVGIILCAVGAIPLGIAAIIAGIALFAIDAYTSGEDVFGMIDGFLKGIFNFIKENAWAILIIGVILIATGVGIVAGVACVIAGIWAIVSPETFDWDFLKNKISEVWEGIKSWFKENVAPIFTPEWWADLFGSIGQGIVDALTGAGRAFHEFIGGICENIGGALSMLGESWSYSIPTINIPALASGAVIPPNREFLAVLGDQKRGTNIETPEGLLRQIVRDEAGSELASSLATALMQVLPMMQGGSQGEGDAVMVLRVGNEELARAISKGNASLMRRGLIDPEISLI